VELELVLELADSDPDPELVIFSQYWQPVAGNRKRNRGTNSQLSLFLVIGPPKELLFD
jgi:hypothetical protein